MNNYETENEAEMADGDTRAGDTVRGIKTKSINR